MNCSKLRARHARFLGDKFRASDDSKQEGKFGSLTHWGVESD